MTAASGVAACRPLDLVIAHRSGGTADAGSDASMDMDAGGDAGADASPDAGMDAGPDVGVDPPPLALDFCRNIPALPTAPVIDGVVETKLFELSQFDPSLWQGDGVADSANGQGSFLAAWRPDGLYVYVDMKDPAVVADPGRMSRYFCDDSLELYLDSDGVFAAPPAYDRPGTLQFIIHAPPGQKTHTRGETYDNTGAFAGADWSSPRYAAFPTIDGYVIEAFITAEDMGLPSMVFAAGGRIGFNLVVNVRTTTPGPVADCPRIGSYPLRIGGDHCGAAYCDVTAFCLPQLNP